MNQNDNIEKIFSQKNNTNDNRIRDISRDLNTSTNTVITALKKQKNTKTNLNQKYINFNNPLKIRL